MAVEGRGKEKRLSIPPGGGEEVGMEGTAGCGESAADIKPFPASGFPFSIQKHFPQDMEESYSACPAAQQVNPAPVGWQGTWAPRVT